MYKVHKFDLSMTYPDELERFLNSLQGEIIAIIPNITGGILVLPASVDFVLVVEKVKAP